MRLTRDERTTLMKLGERMKERHVDNMHEVLNELILFLLSSDMRERAFPAEPPPSQPSAESQARQPLSSSRWAVEFYSDAIKMWEQRHASPFETELEGWKTITQIRDLDDKTRYRLVKITGRHREVVSPPPSMSTESQEEPPSPLWVVEWQGEPHWDYQHACGPFKTEMEGQECLARLGESATHVSYRLVRITGRAREVIKTLERKKTSSAPVIEEKSECWRVEAFCKGWRPVANHFETELEGWKSLARRRAFYHTGAKTEYRLVKITGLIYEVVS